MRGGSGTVSMNDVVDMIDRGDPIAVNEFKRVMKYIGVAVVNILILL